MPELVLAQALDGADLGVDVAFSDLLMVDLGGRRILYGVTVSGGTVVTLDADPEGTFSTTAVTILQGYPRAGATNTLALSGDDLLLVSGIVLGAGPGLALSEDGTVAGQIAPSGFDEVIAPACAELDGVNVVLSRRGRGDGLDLFVETGDLEFTLAGGITDTDELYLGDVSATIALGGVHAGRFLAVSAAENGITLLSASVEDGLNVLSSLGAAEGLPVSSPSDIAVAEAQGRTWAFVAASGTSSVSLVRVFDEGELRLRDHVIDNAASRFARATSLDAVTVGDAVFVAVGGSDGISLFTILPHGRLVQLGSFDTGGGGVASIALMLDADTLTILAADAASAGLARLTWDVSTLGTVGLNGSEGDDIVVGTAMSESLSGDAGNDILFDDAGIDTLTGGAGADLFVLAADGVDDEVADFEPGVDLLDLSGWAMLSAADRLTVEPLADGARLGWQDEVLVVRSADGSPLTAEDFTDDVVLNLSRPVLIPLAQDRRGGSGPDTLIGDDGYDTLYGADGDDLLIGESLDDLMAGEGGADTLYGGAGNDSLSGGEGADSLQGGDGGDFICGDEFTEFDPLLLEF